MRATFRPMRIARTRVRALLYIAGPVAWVISLLIVSYALDHFAAIEVAVLIALGSFVVFFLALLPVRRLRDRAERRAERA